MQTSRRGVASSSLLKHTNQSLRPPDQPPTSMDAILSAILDDDRPRVKKLLKADPRLATCLIDAARLYESKIVHWIYTVSPGGARHWPRWNWRGTSKIIHEFVSFGLNPAIKDSKGKSVFDWAKSSWIRNILSENAAEPG